jgi:RNA polymerase sigma-70 factor, ECF subfamily
LVSATQIGYNTAVIGSEYTSLVQAARGGSLEAFEQLFRTHERKIYGLALHMLQDQGAAEDVLQDTFLRAWDNLGRLRHEKAFSGWLRRIALNLIWDRIRSKAPVLELELESAERVPDPEPAAEGVIQSAGTARLVQEAVMRLPEHQRIVVALYYWEDMPVNEIAATLGIARGTVISRLARGRDTLRRRLSKSLGEEVEAT